MFKKKSLGQHFLKAPAYVRAVADAANLVAGELVLEVGPGDGALTSELLGRGARVIAVEKDHRLIPVLEEKFAQEVAAQRLYIVEGDALAFDLSSSTYVAKDEPYKVVANIPYYITGALIRQFLTSAHQPTTVVVLIQKEVAERVARSKKESLLSLSVKAYGTPHYVKSVPRGAFAPPPDVDSAILCIKDVSRHNFLSSAHEVTFFELLHAGFAQKRKLLRRNLETVLAPTAIEARLFAAGVSLSDRAEDVSLAQWLAVSQPDTK